MTIDTPHLDQIEWPSDLRGLSVRELKLLADELRAETHRRGLRDRRTSRGLGSGWSSSRLPSTTCSIPRKTFSSGMSGISATRTRSSPAGGGGSAPFAREAGSPDSRNAPRASTTPSAQRTRRPRFPRRSASPSSRDLQGKRNRVVAVIGDGALTGGMAYEGMNNAGSMDSRLIVVLNDNEMSIAPPVGAMSGYLSRLISSKRYRSLRDIARHAAERFPRVVEHGVRSGSRSTPAASLPAERSSRSSASTTSGRSTATTWIIFLPILRNVRDDAGPGPILVHVCTQKGKGYAPAEESADRYHGVSSFDVGTGAQKKSGSNAPSFTKRVRPESGDRGASRRPHLRDHRRDAVGNRSRSSSSRSSPTVRSTSGWPSSTR